MRVKLLEHQIEPLYLVKLKPRSILAGDCLSSEHGAREPHEVRSYRKCTIPWNTRTQLEEGTLTNLRCFALDRCFVRRFSRLKPWRTNHRSIDELSTDNLYRSPLRWLVTGVETPFSIVANMSGASVLLRLSPTFFRLSFAPPLRFVRVVFLFFFSFFDTRIEHTKMIPRSFQIAASFITGRLIQYHASVPRFLTDPLSQGTRHFNI